MAPGLHILPLKFGNPADREKKEVSLRKNFQGSGEQFIQTPHFREKEKNMKKLIALFKDEEGATAVEYGIMVALIAAVIIIAVQTLGTNTDAAFDTVNNAIAPGSGG
jgi:pilus assembly protein Flp/PilA